MESYPERRRVPRVESDATLVYDAFGPVYTRAMRILLPAREVDVSVDGGGVGLLSIHPLYRGQAVRIQSGDGGPRYGIVRWVSSAATGFRAGAELPR